MVQVPGSLTQIRSRMQWSSAAAETEQPSTTSTDIPTLPISDPSSPPIHPVSRRFDADYEDFLSNKIDQLSFPWRPEPRAELYERAHGILVKLLSTTEPPLSAVEFKFEENAFRAAVERLEGRRNEKLRAKPMLEKVTVDWW